MSGAPKAELVTDPKGVDVVHPNGNRIHIPCGGAIKPGFRKVSDLPAAAEPEPEPDKLEPAPADGAKPELELAPDKPADGKPADGEAK